MEFHEKVLASALTACLSCQRGKRRCDKSLPSCQRCVKKDVDCTYPSRRTQSITYQPLPKTLTSPSLAIDPSRDDAAISFLAPQIFLEIGLELPRIDLPVPDSVRDNIGDRSDIHDISISFFESTHSWMPIVSKRRFQTHLLHPLSHRQTELSLLAISMKLYCTAPPEASDGRIELYQIAKEFHFKVETAGFMSIPVLQAGIFIALYELSQAIYPAAHLSVSACARYGISLGIDKLGLELIDADNCMRPWVEIEEMRRVWWSVLTLDRFLNLSNPSRRLSTEDPTISFYLPVDTQRWDDDESTSEDAVNILTGFSLKMGILARIAQATYLLSRALKLLSSSASDKASSLEEIVQLRRTLIALIEVTDNEANVRKIEFCSQSAICCSTLLLLDSASVEQGCVPIIDRDSDNSSLISPESASALETLSRLACPFFTECLKDPTVMNSVSIFLIQATYQATSTLIRMNKGNPDTGTREHIKLIMRHLNDLSRRWRVARVYRGILEAEEAMVALKLS